MALTDFEDLFDLAASRKGGAAAFEKTLPKIRNKRPVHEKIAFIYEKLNNERLSQLHKKLAEEENKKGSGVD